MDDRMGETAPGVSRGSLGEVFVSGESLASRLTQGRKVLVWTDEQLKKFFDEAPNKGSITALKTALNKILHLPGELKRKIQRGVALSEFAFGLAFLRTSIQEKELEPDQSSSLPPP